MNGNSRTAKSHGILPYRCGCVAALVGVLGLIAGLVVIYFYPHLIGRDNGRPGSVVMAVAISNAVQQFHADYNKLPVPVNGSAMSGDTDTSPENRLVTVLAGREGPVTNPQNPKNIDYLEGIRPAKANGKDNPPWKDGLMSDATSKAPGIVDPWGHYFRIRLDSDGNKELANPHPGQVAEGRTRMVKRVLVWSAGKDGNWDTWEDNPMSWD